MRHIPAPLVQRPAVAEPRPAAAVEQPVAPAAAPQRREPSAVYGSVTDPVTAIRSDGAPCKNFRLDLTATQFGMLTGSTVPLFASIVLSDCLHLRLLYVT